MAASSIPGRSKRYPDTRAFGHQSIAEYIPSMTRPIVPKQNRFSSRVPRIHIEKSSTCKTNTVTERWYYMKRGRGKNRKIKHMYDIFYTGGSSAPFTNHDRSYRSRDSDDLRPAGPLKAPATAGGTQVVILASPGNAPSRLPRSIIFYAMAAVYASWYPATLQKIRSVVVPRVFATSLEV